MKKRTYINHSSCDTQEAWVYQDFLRVGQKHIQGHSDVNIEGTTNFQARGYKQVPQNFNRGYSNMKKRLYIKYIYRI